MNNRIEILNELKDISALVGGIGNSNVFTVPDGYFATISDTVLICIKEENGTADFDKNRNNVVLNNYFNSLADTIIAKIKVREEVSVMDELKEISPVLSGISKTNPFGLPGHYFDNFPSSILSETDGEYTPVFLKNINTVQPFEVPYGYFDQLPASILSKAQQLRSAKVVNMLGHTVLAKYAAAALIAGAFALGMFKYSNKPVDNIKPVTTAQLDPSIDKGKNMDDKKFDETLNNLSEEDITQYLVSNGSDADIAVLTSSMEENDLPRQEEYLLDNSTLDNFLQEIDTKNLEN